MKKLTFLCGLLFATPFALAFSCDSGARYCKDMGSCEEARFMLNQCGRDKFDRDGDGIPCENVCGKGGKKAKGSKVSKSLFVKGSKGKLTKKRKRK